MDNQVLFASIISAVVIFYLIKNILFMGISLPIFYVIGLIIGSQINLLYQVIILGIFTPISIYSYINQSGTKPPSYLIFWLFSFASGLIVSDFFIYLPDISLLFNRIIDTKFCKSFLRS